MIKYIKMLYIKMIEKIRAYRQTRFTIKKIINYICKEDATLKCVDKEYPISLYDVQYSAYEYGLDKMIKAILKKTNIELIQKNNYFMFDNYLTVSHSFVFLKRYNFGFDCYPMLRTLEILKPNWDTVFDVGANEGIVSCFLAKNAGKVHLFEPCKKTARMARRNIELNGFHNVVINEKAIGKSEGNLLFYDYGEEASGHNSLICNDKEKVIETYEVPVTTLKLYCQSKKIEYIDFLKLDVEGVELDVLLGAYDIIDLHLVEVICFEISGLIVEDWNKEEELINYLEQRGYVLYDLKFNAFNFDCIKKEKKHADVLAIIQEKAEFYRRMYEEKL